jgi:hypothetical protein
LEIEEKYGKNVLRDPELKEQRKAIIDHLKVVKMENLKIFAG